MTHSRQYTLHHTGWRFDWGLFFILFRYFGRLYIKQGHWELFAWLQQYNYREKTSWIRFTHKTLNGVVSAQYGDVMMSTMVSQFTSLTIVCSTVYLGADQRKHKSSASLTFVLGILRSSVNSPHKGQWRGKCFHLMTSSWDHNNHEDAMEWKRYVLYWYLVLKIDR